MVISGGLLVLGYPSGVYWLAFGLLLCICRAIVASWVLLAEIDR